MIYKSGIELPRVQFSLIQYSLIEPGSYFIGFDLDNSGKMSKMDNSGVITVIETEGSAHYIGEEYGGGVIFHVYKDSLGEEHGLICSIIDQSISSPYSNITGVSVGTTTTWNGQANTNLMEAQPGATLGAWKDCLDYTYDGYSDWYLPATDELSLLYQNRYNVNKTLATIVGATEMQNGDYYSSTEYLPTDTFIFVFFNGYISTISKTDPGRVRAIRKF